MRVTSNFENTINHFSKSFREICNKNSEEILTINNSLEKVGLFFFLGGKEKFIERAMKNIDNRCLHHHVFDEKCLKKSFEYAGLKVLDFREAENNWLIIGERK